MKAPIDKIFSGLVTLCLTASALVIFAVSVVLMAAESVVSSVFSFLTSANKQKSQKLGGASNADPSLKT